MSGNSLAVDSSHISFGENKTTAINIGSSSTESIIVNGQRISIGGGTFSASVGSPESATIEIGSTEATIKLLGQVTVNGDEIVSRRRLSSAKVSKAFGFMNTKRFTVDIFEGSKEFTIPFDDGYSSDPASFQVSTTIERFLSITPAELHDIEQSRLVQLSLSIARLRLRTTLKPEAISKIRY